jgi:hypothetical protein
MHVGRLIELVQRAPVTLEEFGALRGKLTDYLVRANQRVVIVSDSRGGGLVTEEVGQAIIRLMKSDNPVIERACYITNPNSPASMKLNQLIQEANNPGRRAFADASQGAAWLAEVLDAQEQARLRAFLSV